MLDIKKLAKLTGLHLSPRQEEKLSKQLHSIVDMLDQIKNTVLPEPEKKRHDVLRLQSIPSKEGNSDSNPDRLLTNVDHPVLGHAVEVKGFVE